MASTNLMTDAALDDLRAMAEAAVRRGDTVTIHGYQPLALLDEVADAQDAISDLEDELEVYYEAEDVAGADDRGSEVN